MMLSKAGTNATQNKIRYVEAPSPSHDSSPYATKGPRTAPDLSRALCTPNEYPLVSLSATDESQASRGGPRKPLPSRSMTRNTLRPTTELEISKMILASVEKPYPDRAKILRFPVRSDNQPPKKFNEDADKSANPSIMPSKAADAPAIVVKKIAKTEKIISELRSVKKLTRPSLSTSGCTPNFLYTGSSGDMGSFMATIVTRALGLNIQ